MPTHPQYQYEGGYDERGAPSGPSAAQDPNKLLSAISASEEKHYQDTFRPLNQMLVGEVNSTRLIDTAKATAGRKFDAGLRRNERQRSRFGFNDTRLDQQKSTDVATGERGLGYDSLVNGARVDQYERNVGLRDELINLSRGIAQNATGDISTAADLQTQRDNNNAQIKSQGKAAKSQMFGQVGGMLLTAAMLGF